jgi:hypothetical protein
LVSLSAVGLDTASEFFDVIGLIIASCRRFCALCNLAVQVLAEIQITKKAKSLGNVQQTADCRLIGVKTTTFTS